MQQNQDDNPMICPSFNSYSSDRLAEIATKVTDEFKAQSQNIDDDYTIDADEFEFSLEASSDQIFGPVFPIFNREFREVDDRSIDREEDEASALRVPLKNLFLEEREEAPSSSSSEADELESVPEGTYCVWRPKEVESSPARCKKSKSTGSTSKRFSIRDFIRRSNSEGKDSYVFLTPKKEKGESSSDKSVNLKLRRQSFDSGTSTGKLRTTSSAHERFYVQNRAMKEGDKRKSYLPYRKDLVGFFANVNGLGKATKAFPPY